MSTDSFSCQGPLESCTVRSSQLNSECCENLTCVWSKCYNIEGGQSCAKCYPTTIIQHPDVTGITLLSLYYINNFKNNSHQQIIYRLAVY